MRTPKFAVLAFLIFLGIGTSGAWADGEKPLIPTELLEFKQLLDDPSVASDAKKLKRIEALEAWYAALVLQYSAIAPESAIRMANKIQADQRASALAKRAQETNDAKGRQARKERAEALDTYHRAAMQYLDERNVHLSKPVERIDARDLKRAGRLHANGEGCLKFFCVTQLVKFDGATPTYQSYIATGRTSW